MQAVQCKDVTTKEPICAKHDQALNKKNYFMEAFGTDYLQDQSGC